MLDVIYTAKYKKDFRACVKRHYNLDLLASVGDSPLFLSVWKP